MSAIHDTGSIHRDVKPENVLVTMIDDDPTLGPRIKLADFGFATRTDPGIGIKVSIGTRLYMAPELV